MTEHVSHRPTDNPACRFDKAPVCVIEGVRRISIKAENAGGASVRCERHRQFAAQLRGLARRFAEIQAGVRDYDRFICRYDLSP